MSTDVQGDLLLLGRGKLYFDRFDANGNATGERFLGNCTRLESSTTDELREKYSSATQDSPLMKSVNVRRTQELAITLDEFDPENVALALMGEAGYLAAQTGGAIVDESVTGKLGKYVKLANRGTIASPLSGVVVTTDPAGTTYTVNDDYIVDAVTGRLYCVPGGAISDDEALLIDYTAPAIAATDIQKIIAGNKNTIEGFMRFIGDPAAGPIFEAEIWKVSINPDGAIGLISDEFAEFPLKGKILDDSANHPTEPLWRLLKLSA